MAMDFKHQSPLSLSEALIFARPSIIGARSTANPTKIRKEFCMNITILSNRIMGTSTAIDSEANISSAVGKEMWDIVMEKNQIMLLLDHEYDSQIPTSSSSSTYAHAPSSIRSTASCDHLSVSHKSSLNHTTVSHSGAGDHRVDSKVTYHQATASDDTNNWGGDINERGDIGDNGNDSWQESDFDLSDQEGDEMDGYSLTPYSGTLSDSIEKDLAKIRSNRLNNRREEVYIPPLAKSSLKDRDDDFFSLPEKAQKFLKSECKVMLVLGDSGGGKSVFLRELEHTLWTKYRPGGRIPLHIVLPEHDKPEEELISKQLRDLGFNEQEISELRRQSRFTLLCDGYDESKCKMNLYVRNKLNDRNAGWDAKMIITCRSTYLGSEYQEQFQPYPQSHYSPPYAGIFQEAVIIPFSMSQIKTYVAEYVSLKSTAWKTNDYLSKFSDIPGLLDLAKNPFHLCMALKTLPNLVGSERDMSKVRINRFGLYDAFIEESIETAKRRQRHSAMIGSEREVFEALTDDNFEACVIRFLKDLATNIFREQEGNPVIRYTSNSDKDNYMSKEQEDTSAIGYAGKINKHNWKGMLFGSDPKSTILRNASPLTRVGMTYTFLHSSLLDYFYARAVFDPDVPDDDEASLHPILSQKILVEHHSILAFLAECAQQEPRFEARLLNMIETSKSPSYTSCAAANAITILVQAGFRFNGRDLKGVKIQGADLTGGCFDYANFKGANLTDVIFFSTWLRRVNFKGATMSGVRFGEGLYLEGCAAVLSCAYSPNGESLVVSLDTGGKIDVYNTKHWEKSTSTFVGHTEPVRSVAFSPKGNRIVTASDDATLRVWKFLSRETLHVLKGHDGPVLDVAFSPCGREVASAGSDRSVKLWNATSGEIIHTLKDHFWPVTCLCFSPNGRLLASGSEDAALLWDVKTGTRTLELDDNLTGASSMAFSPTGDLLAYGLEDGTIQVYNISTTPASGSIAAHSPPMIFTGHSSRVSSLVFSSNGHRIVSAGRDGSVRIWNAHNTGPGMILYSHSHKIHSVALSLRGQQIASGGEDKSVRLWPINHGISRVSSSGHKKSVSYGMVTWEQQFERSKSNDQISYPKTMQSMLALAPKGGYLAFARPERTIRVVSTKAGKGRGEFSATLAGHTDDILCLSFSPDYTQLASGSKDKTARIWNFRNKKIMHVLRGHSDNVTAIAFSPSGQIIATATQDGQVRLWSAHPLNFGQDRSVHSGPITSLMFSSNGRYLLTTSMDRSIREFDVNRESRTHTFSGLAGHSKGVISATYFDTDRKIASAGLDDLIKVWDVRSEQCLATVGGLVGPIKTVAWKVVANTGEVLFVTGCEDKSVRQWKLPLDDKTVYRAELDWTSNCDRLVVLDTNVHGSKDLSSSNLQLLKQRELSARRVSEQ
ncbi:hypothetical protein BGZ95_003407 [Linnemannia exigua]|uniref:NACHT domain-containing protein n=1 Tax=Linnemannia exigua TaxID=604196 RepID=A0AAD4DI27_9FUNG|nr:hypothetical protein BGZ95_003407 [Linnemannia exigua]